MITRLSPHSAASLLALTLIGAFITASIRMDTASQEIAAVSPEIAAAPVIAGMDIPALTARAGTATMPVLSVRDPI